jgi:Fe-S cluster assembly protein SufD
MNTTAYFTEQFEQLQTADKANSLNTIRQEAFGVFNKLGVPTSRNEEWKYTRIGGLFAKDVHFNINAGNELLAADIDFLRLPGHEHANELVFVNGRFSSALSVIRSSALQVCSLEEAAGNHYADIVSRHFNHSARYLKDGINALNTAFVQGGVFIEIKKGKVTEHPLYIYNIVNAKVENVLAQPRSLVHVGENAQVQIVENFVTIGQQQSFTNQVMEIVVEKDANLEYYKIQNDAGTANQVSTTHIRQVGKSYSHAVTISLNGGIVRNNTNVVLEASHCEAHLYGLYFQHGDSHIDNHTVVDNVMPHCFSNELYKGMLDGNSTGVFNGKIYVRQPAQKTNAFQSNKNVLLSDSASINTKPQLEIFADDVKCSHGCTIGKLDEDALFYLQSRGVPEKTAKSMLLHGFAGDVLDKIKCLPIRNYVDQLISERLEYNIL